MEEMKGPSTPLLRCVSAQSVIELVMFADQSLAIRKAGRTHSVWEPSEQDECLMTFMALTGLDQAADFPLVVMLRKTHSKRVQPDVLMN